MQATYYQNINPLLNSGRLNLDKTPQQQDSAQSVVNKPLGGEAKKVKIF